jgi:hypothetical protein
MMPARSAKVFLAGLLPALASAQGFNYFDAANPAQYPKLLSQTGLYADMAVKSMIPEAVKYEINSPFWSDGARKSRWILLKKGRSVAFSERDDYWEYPDSAIFIKHFSIDTIPGDTASRVLWETRLLINKKSVFDTSGKLSDNWYGLSYQWNKSQSDADLISTSVGRSDTIRVYPQGKGKPSAWKKWRFPSGNECYRCHYNRAARDDSGRFVHARSVLGFFTAQLNRPSSQTPGANQLEDFFRQGILQGTRPSAWESAPRWYALDDMSDPSGRGGSLDGRVRAYIASNCSGCHGARGRFLGATHGIEMNLDFHTLDTQVVMEYYHVGRPGLDSVEPKNIAPALVVPGYPQKSYLFFRQSVRNAESGDFFPDPEQMPPLSSYETDAAALDSIRKWILEYKTALSVHRPANRPVLQSPVLHGNRIQLPPGIPGWENLKVTLHDFSGRSWEAPRIGRETYAVPGGLSQGVYILRVGARNFFIRYML